MAENTYDDECNRAELLGIDPPNRIEWEEAERVKRETREAEEFTELDLQEEKITENTGKMDDINNILSITQMRLNKFKKACGSLTNLLKIRGSDGNCSDSDSTANTIEPNSANDATPIQIDNVHRSATDIQQKVTSQVDKLDALLTKAENAQYSMAHQNKQMKSFLNK